MPSRSRPPMLADPSRVASIHHVQITVPVGEEEAARAFYVDLLGLSEIPKPASLRDRGGLWLIAGDIELHFGVEDGVDRGATKSHVAFGVTDLTSWHDRLESAGCTILNSIPIPGYDRLETRDPFGNRVELIQRVDD